VSWDESWQAESISLGSGKSPTFSTHSLTGQILRNLTLSIVTKFPPSFSFCTATATILFNDREYPVPWNSIFDLLNHHRELIHSSVPVAVFEAFIDSLTTQQKPTMME
jgi:hypothetical protein